jgi:hypothetical protein
MLKTDFDNIFPPEQFRQFLLEGCRRKHWVFEGEVDRIQSLFSWGDLSRILCHCELDYPRLTLLRDGDLINPESYLIYEKGWKPGSQRAVVDAKALASAVASGATLIVDEIDSAHGPIGDIAHQFENIFSITVEANLYLSMKNIRATRPHQDPHDMYVVQVLGSKFWKLFGPPDPGGLHSQVIWSGVLTAGNTLYVPDGCLHEVRPVDGPTAHLSNIVSIRGAFDPEKDISRWQERWRKRHDEIPAALHKRRPRLNLPDDFLGQQMA